MKIDFDKTIRAAARLRGHLGLTDPETICRALDLQILRLPLGTARNSIKGFIQRSARCYTIVVNSDLSALLQDIILFHEIGHYWLGHMDASVCTFHDSGFAYSLTSALENEANSFVAEYLPSSMLPAACMSRRKSWISNGACWSAAACWTEAPPVRRRATV